MSALTPDISAMIEASGATEIHVVTEEASGLRAFLTLDDTRLGPAAGGIRTRSYANAIDGLHDVLGLARAMTLKCALAQLDAGGGKCVVLAHDGLDRQRAFETLGAYVEGLGGRFHTAGDLGTTPADLAAAASHSRFVHVDDAAHPLAAAVGTTVLASTRAALALDADAVLGGLTVGVQGAGDIGGAVTAALVAAGAEVQVFDIDGERAQALATAHGARVCHSSDLTTWAVDVVAPCAIGGVLTQAVAERLQARAVVGGANGIVPMAERLAVAEALQQRGITFVPDGLSSSGAVIVGVAHAVMHTDPAPLLAAVYGTTHQVLSQAAARGCSSWEAAEHLAGQRLEAAGAPPEATRVVVSRR